MEQLMNAVPEEHRLPILIGGGIFLLIVFIVGLVASFKTKQPPPFWPF